MEYNHSGMPSWNTLDENFGQSEKKALSPENLLFVFTFTTVIYCFLNFKLDKERGEYFSLFES